MAYGYAGKLLFVDLTNGTINEETPEESLYREWMPTPPSIWGPKA